MRSLRDNDFDPDYRCWDLDARKIERHLDQPDFVLFTENLEDAASRRELEKTIE